MLSLLSSARKSTLARAINPWIMEQEQTVTVLGTFLLSSVLLQAVS